MNSSGGAIGTKTIVLKSFVEWNDGVLNFELSACVSVKICSRELMGKKGQNSGEKPKMERLRKK